MNRSIINQSDPTYLQIECPFGRFKYEYLEEYPDISNSAVEIKIQLKAITEDTE